MCTSYLFNKWELYVPLHVQISGNDSLNKHISPRSSFNLEELLQMWSPEKQIKECVQIRSGWHTRNLSGGIDVCSHVWRPEVYVKMSFSIAFCMIFETGSLNLELTIWLDQADQWATAIILSLSLAPKSHGCTPNFHQVLQIQTPVLILEQQAGILLNEPSL